MPISPTNLNKNVVLPSNLNKTGGASLLLLESGNYILLESYDRIILSDGSSISITNLSKNVVSPTNLNKS